MAKAKVSIDKPATMKSVRSSGSYSSDPENIGGRVYKSALSWARERGLPKSTAESLADFVKDKAVRQSKTGGDRFKAGFDIDRWAQGLALDAYENRSTAQSKPMPRAIPKLAFSKMAEFVKGQRTGGRRPIYN